MVRRMRIFIVVGLSAVETCLWLVHLADSSLCVKQSAFLPLEKLIVLRFSVVNVGLWLVYVKPINPFVSGGKSVRF